MGRNPETPLSLGFSVIEKINNERKLHYDHGWYDCKQEVLRILKTGELSYNEIFCSDEAIEQIEKL